MIKGFRYRRPCSRRSSRSPDEDKRSESDRNNDRSDRWTRDQEPLNNRTGQHVSSDARVTRNSRSREQRPKRMFHVDRKRKPPLPVGKQETCSIGEKNSPARGSGDDQEPRSTTLEPKSQHPSGHAH